MGLVQRLSSIEVIDLGPLQLESLLLPLEKILSGIRGSLVDELDYVNNPFANRIRTISLGDLYDVLEETGHLSFVDEEAQYLSILSHNYRLLSQRLLHYNTHVTGFDNIFVRRKFINTLCLN